MQQFEYKISDLQLTADAILKQALKLGASAANVSLHESIDKNVEILNSQIDNFESNISHSLNIVVYLGNNNGAVSISQLNNNTDIKDLILRALELAKSTQPDIYNYLPEANLLATTLGNDLQLFNPYEINNHQLIDIAKDVEHIALNSDKKINTSDGASCGYRYNQFVLANTNGLNLGYQSSQYYKNINLIGKDNQERLQTDSWYSSARDFTNLLNNTSLASVALQRTLRRLTTGTIKAGNHPVIFEHTIAKSLISNCLHAISGSSLYRKTSFLNSSLQQQIFPKWVNVIDDPFIIKGNSSCYFDAQGVNVSKRLLIKNGQVNEYLLDCYYARKLNLITTGNAGGHHNILVNNNFTGDLVALAKVMHQGVIIIETIGFGTNLATGDYSVGASGLWVEQGEIKFFVNNMTIAGNLKQLYKDIEYISNDYDESSSIKCGSILVKQISVAI
jgi:PmbA protein